ncbi:MAG: hypothetical protein AB7S65_11750 [Sulfuricurvum sp.]
MRRQTLYLIILSVFLLICVVSFSFLALIPKGKEYRTLRLQNKKEMYQLELAQRQYDQEYERLKDLQSQNRHTISAFDTAFDAKRFSKLYKKEFEDLYLTELKGDDENGSFTTYEVNATSKITSPESFYNFLEAVNKSEWIIAVNFPIYFERDGDKIRSSFTMKVHNRKNSKEEMK